MNKISIITDNCCDLPQSFIEDNNIPIVPIYYQFNDELFGDEKKLTSKQFFENLSKGLKAKTSSCNPQKIIDIFEKELDKGNDIIYISISSALSGNYNNVNLVKNAYLENYEGRIKIIDSLRGSVAEGLMVLKAIQMKKENYSTEEIVNHIEECKLRYNIEFYVPTLEYLKNGGRLTSYQAIAGKILNLKPIISINDNGQAILLSKTRGERAAIDCLLNSLKSSLDTNSKIMSIVHSDCLGKAEELKVKLIKEGIFEELSIPIEKCFISEISHTIASHVGPGALGLAYQKKR